MHNVRIAQPNVCVCGRSSASCLSTYMPRSHSLPGKIVQMHKHSQAVQWQCRQAASADQRRPQTHGLTHRHALIQLIYMCHGRQRHARQHAHTQTHTHLYYICTCMYDICVCMCERARKHGAPMLNCINGANPRRCTHARDLHTLGALICEGNQLE